MAQKKIADRRIYGRNARGQEVLVAAKGQPIPAGFEVDKPRTQSEDEQATPKPKSRRKTA